MHKLLVSIAATLLILASCAKHNGADVSELLKTIPADASMVMVVDLEEVLQEAGCTVSDGVVTPGKDLAKALQSSANEDLKRHLADLQDSGVEWSAMAVFSEGYNAYLTGFIHDTSKFKAKVEEVFGEQFTSGEVSTCGNIAMIGERYWVCLSSRNTIQENDIRHFNSLSEKQSILSNETVTKMQPVPSDIEGWGDIKGVLNMAGLDFASRAVCSMAMETIFVDAVEVEWKADFDKDELEVEMEVINSKSGIAKFNFPVEKIDESVIKNLNTSAAGFGALAISEKMIENLKAQTAQQSMSILGVMVNMMGSVRGTTAVAFDTDGYVNGTISTTGHGTADFADMLSQMDFKVNKEGKDLRISKGTVAGALTSAEAANLLKGSVCGIALSTEGIPGLPQFKTIAFNLIPDKGGLKLQINMKAKDPKLPLLFTLLNNE